jgi:3-phytase
MAYLPTAITADTVRYQQLGAIKLPSQLEGCVHDDATGILYFGEEEQGLWKSHLSLSGNSLNWTSPVMIDAVDGPSGTTGDIEGVALYTDGDRGYVITSSQGNDSYAVYERSGDNRFIGRFRIRTATDGIIDGAQETDGIEVTSMSIGADYPDGMLVVQDGFNAPRGTPQNFKLIDWRDIARALELD